MGDADFRSLLKRGLERHPTPADFSFGASRRTAGTEPKTFDSPAITGDDIQTHRTDEMRTEPTSYVRAQNQASTPLDDIAALVQTLTYGEMIELAGAIWKSRGEGAVTGETLPPMLHRWSTGHLAAAQSS
jgi:hypothetical protein